MALQEQITIHWSTKWDSISFTPFPKICMSLALKPFPSMVPAMIIMSKQLASTQPMTAGSWQSRIFETWMINMQRRG